MRESNHTYRSLVFPRSIYLATSSLIISVLILLLVLTIFRSVSLARHDFLIVNGGGVSNLGSRCRDGLGDDGNGGNDLSDDGRALGSPPLPV